MKVTVVVKSFDKTDKKKWKICIARMEQFFSTNNSTLKVPTLMTDHCSPDVPESKDNKALMETVQNQLQPEPSVVGYC